MIVAEHQGRRPNRGRGIPVARIPSFTDDISESLGQATTYSLDHDFYALNYVYMQCFMHKIR